MMSEKLSWELIEAKVCLILEGSFRKMKKMCIVILLFTFFTKLCNREKKCGSKSLLSVCNKKKFYSVGCKEEEKNLRGIKVIKMNDEWNCLVHYVDGFQILKRMNLCWLVSALVLLREEIVYGLDVKKKFRIDR